MGVVRVLRVLSRGSEQGSEQGSEGSERRF